MNRLSASILALGLAAAVGTVSAQSSGQYPNGYYSQASQPSVDRYGQANGAHYDYARVIRVDPVIQSGYNQSGYNGSPYSRTSNRGTSNTAQHCYQQDSYAGNDPYNRDRYYGQDGYNRNDGYGSNDRYYPQQRDGYGSNTGRTMATVIGGIAGAVLGSQVGGGSGSTAAAAIGSMVGGLAGRQVYENSQRNRARTGTVQVCDPVPVRDNDYYSNSNGYNGNGYSNNGYGNNGYSNTGYGNDSRVTAYDVTYQYGNRNYTTRTNYHPGDRIRVRVDVRPE